MKIKETMMEKLKKYVDAAKKLIVENLEVSLGLVILAFLLALIL
jgi:hypothetical protein